jgi:DNA (cytosine-5)-methyltransferase 1
VNARAYYNEIDAAAGAVLRELIDRNVIMPGDVDSRSIKDVQPGDLAGYTQCHFFAGGGLWSVAARLAGWPDERPLWTGSCPCQPFSAAGKQLGTDDPRHLWPDFHRLISACRPAVVMGEQVAGSAGYDWFDGVRSDLESEGYQGRAVDIPACAVDAPHQRNRLYWIANLANDDERGERGHDRDPRGATNTSQTAARSENGDTAERTHDARGSRIFGNTEGIGWREGRPEHELRGGRDAVASADVQLQPGADSRGCTGRPEGALGQAKQRAAAQRPLLRNGSWWADAEWIVSPLDGKARRAKSGIPFLVDGLPGRVDLWRVGGNAIVPILAAEVISAFLDTE